MFRCPPNRVKTIDPTSGNVVETLPSTTLGVHDTITRHYDSMSRLGSTTYSGSSTPNVALTYDEDSNVKTMIDGATGTVAYGYDYLNHLASVVRGAGPGFAYVTDNAGNLTQRTYPSGAATYYKYDADNRLCSARVASSATCTAATATTYAYNVATGKVTKTMPNGIVVTTTLDNAGRVTNLTNKLGSATVSSYKPTLDAAGNPTAIAANPGGGIASETQTYTYYKNERLKKACFDAAGTCSGSTGLEGVSYTYDNVGNIGSKSTYGASPATTTYSYNSANQLVTAGSTNYTYDANGNEKTAGSASFTHNLANEMISAASSGVTSDTYTYDGSGDRLTDTESGTTSNYAWDTNASVPFLATETQGGTVLRRYIYADSLNSVKISGVTGESYYTHDSMGSVANLTDSAGAAQRSYTYEPYGNTRKTTNVAGAPGNAMRFDSELYDASTSLFDNGARTYDPGTGGFLQNDPAAQSPSYAFAADRPTVMSDPSGLFPWKAVAVGIVVAALAVGAAAACIAATVGICAGVTLAGVFEGAAAAGAACEADQGECEQLGQDVSTGGEDLFGTRVFRVWGQNPETPDLAESQSGPWGQSWTRVDPSTITKYRDVAGLPDESNMGRFVSEGILRDATGVQVTNATQIGANLGGIDELLIPNAASQIDLLGVYGVNPPF